MAVVTIVGAGVIGVSWARLFGAAGWEVRISDRGAAPAGNTLNRAPVPVPGTALQYPLTGLCLVPERS
ncbi:3-hydroxyacyl-CoA dehydrogenase NAD-binding domain-containing protein [Streptomyces noursei]|uniref:3-hydroxyacyl-CoA dehydrogenase NAD-binding domain-containing protein n=1 Tax=Streptomyces noursei TaxID=1971 RepID=UPI0037FB292D